MINKMLSETTEPGAPNSQNKVMRRPLKRVSMGGCKQTGGREMTGLVQRKCNKMLAQWSKIHVQPICLEISIIPLCK